MPPAAATHNLVCQCDPLHRSLLPQVPIDRWDVDLATASGIVKRRRDPMNEKYSRHGSFVRDFDLFDNRFFAVSEKDAAEIDPQQRVLIQVRGVRSVCQCGG